ncbi:hypothetical protein N7494_001839, partial [Penicillium frequentans]
LEATDFINQSPVSLQTALGILKNDYKSHGHHIKESVERILEKTPRLRKDFGQPDLSSDSLYRSDFIHPTRNHDLVLRAERDDVDNPRIHYGLVASSNQSIRNASTRDRLAAEADALCFEMEAAGTTNHVPCLVIRGICDYTDSQKNKQWQGYAAMTAAAYARELLHLTDPNKVDGEKKIIGVLPGVQTVEDDYLNITQKQLELQENNLQTKWSKIQEECFQSFDLTTGINGTVYDWYKDRVEARAEGIGEWLINHDNFQKWLGQNSGPLLVLAEPGYGKSVLARYLIDDLLPRSSTICYFFFKDQDQNTAKQALCALLHQLFSHKPPLIEHAMEVFKKNGRNLIQSTASLWSIFEKATRDPQAGSVIIVLDAMDECAEPDFNELMHNIKRQIHSVQSDHRKLKILLTSRPYNQMMEQVKDLHNTFPISLIKGEEMAERSSQELSHVIQHRAKKLSEEKGLSEEVGTHLALKLIESTGITYLWVNLLFEFLQKSGFEGTIEGVDSALAAFHTREEGPSGINKQVHGMSLKDSFPGSGADRKSTHIFSNTGSGNNVFTENTSILEGSRAAEISNEGFDKQNVQRVQGLHDSRTQYFSSETSSLPSYQTLNT